VGALGEIIGTIAVVVALIAAYAIVHQAKELPSDEAKQAAQRGEEGLNAMTALLFALPPIGLLVWITYLIARRNSGGGG
jgi:hypothetical protein